MNQNDDRRGLDCVMRRGCSRLQPRFSFLVIIPRMNFYFSLSFGNSKFHPRAGIFLSVKKGQKKTKTVEKLIGAYKSFLSIFHPNGKEEFGLQQHFLLSFLKALTAMKKKMEFNC
jgi:hypothetical protein